MNRGERLEDRVAVVTGGAQGIGLGIGTRLAEEGAIVILADIAFDRAKAAAAKLVEQGLRAGAARVDIADAASVAELARQVDEAHGRCEILVNNAGIGADTHIETMAFEDYQRVIAINQDGAVRMVMAFVPLLKKGGEGRRILNIASIQGLRGWPNQLAYATAKGAMVNFTRALACDLAPHNIMVNAIAPGFVDTPMSIQPDGSHEYDADWFRDIYVKYGRIPMRRYGKPADMAGPAFFLCSDDAQYVTGQVLSVDGGASATF
ncbi:SDR family oxidoreductase [Nordella sp. HKS 07]|uniref:SDR family NAD(P)-dependent oxidoreductase n=1 Tax=Nordella sp. HKS 07 TaxID=2712222 RepID=UPI0013E105E1|nr:SDR family NAD(P)-dependent oxidoreductase [Nordella sp. HKS 07]QIG52234.1 SDR family oxidoreductase [Nordella sp. HKS 07]